MMVCLGNICRSPIAEGILQAKIDKYKLEWEVASSGTSGFHNGQLPDRRSMEIAIRRGIDISHQRSAQFCADHLAEYDFILAMDESNMEDILGMCSTEKEKAKVQLIMDYGHDSGIKNIPDPYYGAGDGFAQVYDMLVESIDGFVQTMILAQD